MRQKIYLRCLAVTSLALVVFLLISAVVLHAQKREDYYAGLSMYLKTIVLTESEKDTTLGYQKLAEQLKQHFPNYRITFIRLDGTVAGDSDVKTLENHKDRPEVQAAFAGGEGRSSRRSSSVGEELLYVARQFDSSLVIRVSTPLSSAYTTLYSFLPALLMGIAVAMIITVPIARHASQAAILPITQVAKMLEAVNREEAVKTMEFDHYPEFEPIIRSVVQLTGNIQRTMKELNTERKKTQYMLDSMDRGLLIIDQNQKVIMVNTWTLSMFSVRACVVNKVNTICHDALFLENVEKMLKEGKSITMDLDLHPMKARIISCSLAAVNSEVLGVAGGVIFLNDVTQTRRLERMRKDFVANVSHELKTPITSIMGFSELISNGMVKVEKIPDYLGFIHKDAIRLANLVEDILTLETIENANEVCDRQSIRFKKAVEAEIEALRYRAQEKQVAVSYTGEDLVCSMNPKDLSYLLSNLISNGIKYNHPNGQVTITARRLDEDTLWFCVSDTGIGMVAADVERIFERFYRVDKGRSRELGGTGLGLAIVKHVSLQYEGTITVESQPQQGTTMTLTLKA